MENPSFNGKPKASVSFDSRRSRNAVAFGLPLNDPIAPLDTYQFAEGISKPEPNAPASGGAAI